MNLQELTQVCASLVNDRDQTKFGSLYTQALNLGQQQFAYDSGCLFDDHTITVVAGTAGYDLDDNFYKEIRVNHKGLRLQPMSRESLYFYSRGVDWRTLQGTPIGYIIDPEIDEQKITLFPIPQDADAGDNLIITFNFIPEDMTTATSLPWNNFVLLAPYRIGICYWAAWLLLGYDTATSENIAKRKEILSMYNDKVTEAVDNYGNTVSEGLRMRGGRYW